MNKEKQIEDILTDIRKFIGYDTPYTQKKALADYLFEHYQPKLPEDSVVLSKEEWKQIKNSLYYSKEVLEKKLQRERKETAEKIIKYLLDEDNVYENGTLLFTNQEILELAKQFGVEIKE